MLVRLCYEKKDRAESGEVSDKMTTGSFPKAMEDSKQQSHGTTELESGFFFFNHPHIMTKLPKSRLSEDTKEKKEADLPPHRGISMCP